MTISIESQRCKATVKEIKDFVTIEQMIQVKYLGTIITNTGKFPTRANVTAGCLDQSIWNILKIRIYKTAIRFIWDPTGWNKIRSKKRGKWWSCQTPALRRIANRGLQIVLFAIILKTRVPDTSIICLVSWIPFCFSRVGSHISLIYVFYPRTLHLDRESNINVRQACQIANG